MTNVAAVRESEWNKDGTIVKVTTVTLEDGREAPGYDLPEIPEVGKPLPEGWEFATAKSGKLYIKVPKSGKGGFGGATAFRNTKEGQVYEQERMDRRTALMQAVGLATAMTGDAGGVWSLAPEKPYLLILADGMYDWLRQTAAPGNPVSAGTGATPSSRSAPVSIPSVSSGEEPPKQSKADWGQVPEGKQGSAPVGCAHENTSPLGPTGRAVPAGKVFCLDCRTVIREP